MAGNILGKLMVMLGADTASFEQGMNKASKIAAAQSKEIKRSLGDVGDALDSALANFGGDIGARLSEVGGQVKGLAASFGSLLASLGPVGVAAGIVAAGFLGIAAADAGLIAVAAHAAKTAADMYDMSQKTGVSVETLTSLGYAAKQVGVEQETLANGLERLSRSVYQAATGVSGADTAYRRMGIDLRDSNGELKSTQELVSEVADKFAAMKDGTAKTALAMQLFGRAGAELIPLLNEGSKGIKKLTDEATLFGVVLNTETAKRAHEFEDGLTRIGAAVQGVAYKAMSALLPTMNAVIAEIVDELKDPNSSLRLIGWTIDNVLIPSIKDFAVGAMSIFEEVGVGLESLKAGWQSLGVVIDGVSEAVSLAAKGHFSDAADAVMNSAAAASVFFYNKVSAAQAAADERMNKFMQDIIHPPAPEAQPTPKGGSGVDTQSGKLNTVQEMIKKLAAQAAAEKLLAEAQAQDTAQTWLATAAKDAENQVEQIRASGLTQNIRLTQKQEETIRKAAFALTLYKQVVANTNSIEQSVRTADLAVAAQERLNAAYTTGSLAALRDAETQNQLAPVLQRVADTTEALALLREENIKDGGKEAAAIATLNVALKNEHELLQKLIDDLDKQQKLKVDAEALKEAAAYQQQTRDLQEKIAYAEQNRAVLEAAGLSEQAIDAKIYDWNRQLIQQQDDMLLKTNSLGAGVKAAMQEIVYNSQTAAMQMKDAFTNAFNSLEDNLAALLTGQGTSFKSMLANLSKSLMKIQIDAILKPMLASIGLGKKEMGTSANPMVVRDWKDNGSLIGGSTSSTDSTSKTQDRVGKTIETFGKKLENTFGNLFTKIGGFFNSLFTNVGSTMKSLLSGIGSILHSIVGGLGGFFGHIFGGFRAGGGDVTPGSSYVVGEKGPELFTPAGAGSITPAGAFGSRSQVVYNIDARGADAGVEQRLMVALRMVEDRAVVRSVATMSEIQRRNF